MPNLKKRGDIWHYSFTVDGKRYRETSGTGDKRLAEDIAIKHEDRVRRAAVHGQEAILTFPEAVAEYLNDGKDGRFTAPLIRHFRKWKVKDITGPEIRKAAKILYPEASPATWNRQVITPMRAIINHVAEAKRGMFMWSGLCSEWGTFQRTMPHTGRCVEVWEAAKAVENWYDEGLARSEERPAIVALNIGPLDEDGLPRWRGTSREDDQPWGEED